MIKYLLYLFSLITFYQLFTSCANVTPPSGGPRDTIAPIIVKTIPKNKSINYTGKSIIMEYDERIKTAKIKDQLIITPLIESDYEYTINKNIIKLLFEETFQDSITYTLNFRESIQDITEGNPTKDNKFTFSTGSFIDSMSIEGYVKELLTYDTIKNIVIGLYKAEDTITIFNGSPYYFTELDDEGKYLIENIKNGKYLLFAFLDENKNLTLETNSEAYGFVQDTILLDSGIVSKNIDLIRLDLTEFKLMTALPSGKYFDINFNKYITQYNIHTIQSEHKLYTNLAKENKSIRFYNNFNDIDSLQVYFSVFDSLETKITDTLYVRFVESRRKKMDFNIKIYPEKDASIEKLLVVKVEFNKPILTVNSDSIYIQYDTTIIANIHDSIFEWNKQRDFFSFKIDIDKSKADTILNRRMKRNQLIKDSVKTVEKEAQVKKQISKSKKEDIQRINSGLQLYFGQGSFYSADLDTSRTMKYNYKFIIPEYNGIQELNIQTEYENFTLQLLKENFEIVNEIKNKKSILLKNIKPGKYKIRVLIDANNDGKWSPGNMLKQIEPEPVYMYPDLIIIRADWRTTLDLTF